MTTQLANTTAAQHERKKDAEDADEPPYRSHDISDYCQTFHLAEKTNGHIGRLGETRTNPPITGDVIRKCIQQGECKPARGDRHKLVATVDDDLLGSVEWELYVRFHESGTHDVLTAYAPAHHDKVDLYGGDQR
jgi:hypothetical protein